MTFCPCCGYRLGRGPDVQGRWHWHTAEPCQCQDCLQAPNYCTDCGAFIGNPMHRTLHDIDERIICPRKAPTDG